MDEPEIHDLVVSDDADRLLICPKCQYKAMMQDGQLVRLVPGDPTVAHVGAW